MIYIGDYPMNVGVATADAPAWSTHVLQAGRDAAFVDTGYLVALLNPHDQQHRVAREHWETTKAIFYTSSLVVSEIVRQMAKANGPTIDQNWRWDKVSAVNAMFVADRRVTLCSPPRALVLEALTELIAMQRELESRLDLCDSVSMMILDQLRHRRVCGFDNHFRAVGASLEPA
jgi:predicted nucleic acid-binding protein